ncbi:MAG: S-layer homology domain-containing protein [Enterococcus sp.]|nr:S-layer homology domain-containing protein [Enterococcus sp.]
MKNRFHKATSITGLALVGAMCFGTLPANAAPTAREALRVNAITETSTINETSAINLKNRAQITEIFNLLNAYRQEKGLEPLLFSVPASEESQAWSEVIAGYQRLEHNQNAGQDSRIKAVWWGVWLENVAARWDNDGAAMFQQWVNSPSHNANLLNPDVNTVGIGLFITGNKDFVKYPNNYYMWGTQNFYSFKDGLPAQTYTTPDDYFEGRPALSTAKDKAITIRKPSADYNKGTYTLPSIEGVEYYVNGEKKPAGTHSSNWVKITIEYRPLAGYYLNTTNKKYSEVIDFSQYLQQAYVVTPKFDDTTGKYTIPDAWGVDYTVNGAKKSTGTYDSGWTAVTIIARAQSGYKLVGDTTSWSHTFVKPVTPTPTPTPTPTNPTPVTKVTPANPTFDKAKGKYSIPSTAGVQYKVNGANTSAGTYTGNSKTVITAVAKSGYQLTGATSWRYTFVNDSNAKDFKDSRGTAFAKEIRWMRASGISNGWANDTYQPYSSIKRDAMAAFIYRMAGSPDYTPPTKSAFKDVPTNHVFYKEISWLASTGITTGWADGTFRPNDNVNRDSMAAFMYRYGSMCHISAVDNYQSPVSPKFKDTPKGITFYKEMSWMADAGISTGWDDKTYRPFTAVTREQMAAFLSRLDTFVANQGGCK